MSNSEQQTAQPTSTDPLDRDNSHWAAGVFYVNHDNPHLLVPKRLGGGWTFNFAHPIAWVFMTGILALIGLLVFLLPHLIR